MKSADKHHKLINSLTGYVIFYHSVNSTLSEDKCKEELEKVKIRVAVQNSMPVNTLYWEEIKEEDK